MATPPSAPLALVPVPRNRLVLVDAPALSREPRLMLVGAGVPLPGGVRAVAAVNRRLGNSIVQAQAGTRGSALLTHALDPLHLVAPTYTPSWTWADFTTPLPKVLGNPTPGSSLLIGGPGYAYAAARGGSTRGHASALTVMALGAGPATAVVGGGGYDGYADAEAQLQAYQVTQILRMRARLEVFLDKVPMACRPALRAMLSKLNAFDPTATVHHWVVPRLESELRQALGEEIFKWVLGWDVELDKLSVAQECLINACSSITGSIKNLSAQIRYSIMQTDERKAALPFDHALYDVTPAFIKTISNIEGDLHRNIDLLSFTDRPPVTLQHTAANQAKALFLTVEAIVDFRGLVNPELDVDSRKLVGVKSYEPDPVSLMKELKTNQDRLLTEEYKMLEYVTGPCRMLTETVQRMLMKLEKDVRPLRLRD